ncbi:MAG: class I poly(R)-hydroxyalkanoic acid synthase [Burkholderiaceae bacterium]
MNTPNSQFFNPEWMSQLSGQTPWQNPFNAQMGGMNAFTDKFKELGVEIPHAVASQLQRDYMRELSALWQETMTSTEAAPAADRRFSSPEWQSNKLFAFNAAVYLLNAKYLTAMGDAVEGTEKAKQRVRFAVQQMTDAMSPANFFVSNPEAQQKIIETKGESLKKGITQMLHDMKKGRISQSDESAFEVGKNIATTEGAVVFENEFFQLLQYRPLTETVYEKPLFILPPCINKFYILDLQPENSVVRYAVEQGHTVFLVSWRNPDKEIQHATWQNYIEDVAIKAIHLVQEISGQKQINALGFCVGGTIISTAAAVLAARGEKPFASLTLLTSLLDFSDTGVIDVFIDEMQVALREQTIGKGGLLPARDLASTFSILRANDLVWNYVKTNYLKGEAPPPFDLLYWNADGTNLPGPMFCWYLRNMYLENNLKEPNKLTVAGQKVDLGRIDAPTFIYASYEDHIVPWTSAFASTTLLNQKKPGQNRFVLGASGHIAGVINPPKKKKRHYWTNDTLAANSEEWFKNATQQAGSWWPEWAAFLETHAGSKVKAPSKYGNATYQPIEPAPGRYVKAKA